MGTRRGRRTATLPGRTCARCRPVPRARAAAGRHWLLLRSKVLVPLASSAQASPPMSGSAFATWRPPELKHSGRRAGDRHAGSDVGEHAALHRLDRVARHQRQGAHGPEGAAAAGAVLVVQAVWSVRKKTTWRWRRTASACARRRPFCSASLTVRTWALRTQVVNDGIAMASRIASSVMVTISSTMVKPRGGGEGASACVALLRQPLAGAGVPAGGGRGGGAHVGLVDGVGEAATPGRCPWPAA